MVSLPFQYNYLGEVGPGGDFHNELLKIQPVIPFVDVSQTSLQPILTRSFPKSWSMTFSSETTYNWKADSGEAWTVPLGISASKVVKIGQRPVSFGMGGFYNVERPDAANRWKTRATVTLVFPE